MNHFSISLRYFLVFLLFCSVAAVAQSIQTGAVNAHYCSGDNISVSFTADGTFNPGNAFILQLSGLDGSFSNGFKNLGSISQTVSGTITATLSPPVIENEHYRVRVVASNPLIIGNDNGADISIGMIPKIYIHIEPSARLAVVGQPITFYTDYKSGVSYFWNFGPDATPATSTNRESEPIIYSSPGEKKITLTVTSTGKCSTLGEYKIKVISIPAPIPQSAIVVSPGGPQTVEGAYLWVCPGASIRIGDSQTQTAFVEPGGNVAISCNGTAYARAGSSVTPVGDHDCGVIIYEEGVGIPPGTSAYSLIKLSSVSFDYTNAPAGGCAVPTSVPSFENTHDELSLYPHPASDRITVTSRNGADIRGISIVNLLGSTLHSSSLAPGEKQYELSLSSLAKGMYFLHIQTGNIVQVRRMIVQ